MKIGLHNQVRYTMPTGISACPRFWKAGARRARARNGAALHLRHGGLGQRQGRQPALRRAAQAGDCPRLATNPKLLLLDEPAAGMNPTETEELMENIVKIRDSSRSPCCSSSTT